METLTRRSERFCKGSRTLRYGPWQDFWAKMLGLPRLRLCLILIHVEPGDVYVPITFQGESWTNREDLQTRLRRTNDAFGSLRGKIPLEPHVC